jgi:hypothetical protein
MVNHLGFVVFVGLSVSVNAVLSRGSTDAPEVTTFKPPLRTTTPPVSSPLTTATTSTVVLDPAPVTARTEFFQAHASPPKSSSLFDALLEPQTSLTNVQKTHQNDNDVLKNVRWATVEETHVAQSSSRVETSVVTPLFSPHVNVRWSDETSVTSNSYHDDNHWSDRKYDVSSNSNHFREDFVSGKPATTPKAPDAKPLDSVAKNSQKRRPFIEVVIEESYPEINGQIVTPSSYPRDLVHQFERDPESGENYEKDNIKYVILNAFKDGSGEGGDGVYWGDEIEEEVLHYVLGDDQNGEETSTVSAEYPSMDVSNSATATSPRTSQLLTKTKTNKASWSLVKDKVKAGQFLNSEAVKWLRANPNPALLRHRHKTSFAKHVPPSVNNVKLIRRPPKRFLTPPPLQLASFVRGKNLRGQNHKAFLAPEERKDEHGNGEQPGCADNKYVFLSTLIRSLYTTRTIDIEMEKC